MGPRPGLDVIEGEKSLPPMDSNHSLVTTVTKLLVNCTTIGIENT
jgi:hypothetical protein